MQYLVIEYPCVVQASALVSARTSEHNDVDTRTSTERTGTLLPRAIPEKQFMFASEVVVFALPVQQRAIAIDAFDNQRFGRRLLVASLNSIKTALLHFGQLVFGKALRTRC